MKIYERLKQDHDRQRELAERIEQTQGDSAERQELWAEFKPEAKAHANAEEQTFYAALIERPDGQEKTRHSVAEHKQADDLIGELDGMDMAGSAWLRGFKKLKEMLEHHMEEEEHEVFVLARKLLTDEEASRLAAEFEQRKTAEV